MRLRGQAENTVDSKGRLAVPAKMRAAADLRSGDPLVVTLLDGCLMLYPLAAWEKKEDEFAAQNQYRPEVRDTIRHMLAQTEDLELDGQGRVVLPRKYLEYAQIGPGTSALVLGVLDHMEVWNPDRYHARMNAAPEPVETLVERTMVTNASLSFR